jgi:N,N'-diacetyllegionaminate synthase
MDGVVTAVHIAGRTVGSGAPCVVIAEAGVNHNGDADLARQLIDAAATAGADAIKFQTFCADRLTTADAPKAAYQKTADGDGSQLDMLRRLELPEGAWKDLRDHCRNKGILFLSSPFDEQSADFLDGLDIAAFKIPSGEITNPGFLHHVAAKGRPLIVSTGMAELQEVRDAVKIVRSVGDVPLVLLHCVSAYPAPAAECNLRAMATMRQEFDLPIGWSDHCLGNEVALAAVALGACVIEKHLTLDRNLPGPDQAASAEPAEFAALIAGIRKIEAALGNGVKVPVASEGETRDVARKRLVAARNLAKGELVDTGSMAIRRPGTGLPPAQANSLIGRTLRVDVQEGALLTPDMFE